MSFDTRLRALQCSVEGVREIKEFEYTYGSTQAERRDVTYANAWHRRILSEIDFCMQMRRYGGVDGAAEIDAALSVLEQAQAADGAIPDSVCKKAEECLLPLAKEAHTYTLLLIGHAHLDMNWMWSWDETVASVLATFRTMLRLMEEYPEFTYSQSQASTYQLVEEYAPEMMPEIQKRIREGRWEVTASAWVETDKNMPGTESLMNHIVYTKKYLKEHWDVDPASLDIDFSPDTFGHSAFLPELDLLGGVKYYYHCRGLGGTDKILYRWRAPNGKELLTYKEPYWYNSGITPAPAVGLPRTAQMCGGLRVGMAVYGVGDHGGGPTRRDLDAALEMQSWPVFPQLRFGRMREYFAAAESVRDRVSVVEHELNSIFTGCYTTQSRVKKGNRRAENALCRAEGLAALAARELGESYASEIFEKAWQKTLFTHFHDILTGSCVQDSREYAMGLYQQVLSAANTRASRALEAFAANIDTAGLSDNNASFSLADGAGVGFGLADGNIPTQENGCGMTRILHVFNTTGSPRHENAELTVWDWPGRLDLLSVTDEKGNAVPFECICPKTDYWAHLFFKVLVEVRVPAHGYVTLVLREKEPEEVTVGYMLADERVHHPIPETVLENAYLRARFDSHTGQLCSLIDKATGAERLRGGEKGGLRYILSQRNPMSAWVIERYLDVKEINTPVRFTVRPGTLSNSVTVEYPVALSCATVTYSLGRQDRHLGIALHIDWREQAAADDYQPLLCYTLPLCGTTGRMLCDVPGGVQWRPQQELDVPCQKYGAAEFGDGRVLALASDCKYGFRLAGGDLSVTLINTAYNPDPYPERGIQDVNLFVLSAEADAAQLTRLTEACMLPLQYVTNTAHPGKLPVSAGLMETVGDSVVFTGIAQRDGKLTVRMYETAGAASPVSVRLYSPVSAARLTDLLGTPLDIPVAVDGKTVSFTLPANAEAELRMV